MHKFLKANLLICIMAYSSFVVGKTSKLTGKFLDELPQDLRPSNYSTIVSSVSSYSPQLGSKCSFVFISNEGHALSSKHCFDELFKSKNLVEIKKFDGLQVGSYKKEEIKKDVYPITIEDSTSPINVEILAVGEGFEIMPDFINLTPAQIKTLKKNDLGMFSDFVLFKIPIKNNICVKTKEAKKNEAVFVLGIRDQGLNTKTYKKVFSFGNICETFNMAKHIKEMGALSRLIFENTLKKLENKFSSIIKQIQPEIIFHSAIMAHGASGGGLFSSDGYLIGINSFILLNSGNEEKYIPGAYASISIEKIKQLLKKDMSTEQIEIAFKCDN